MDALGMLNALIGLALVYFVLSLIVSALMEWITQWRGYRGQTLELATARLLGLNEPPKDGPKLDAVTVRARSAPRAATSRTPEEAFRAFFRHAEILALQEKDDRKPSYIPGGTYAAVFAESVLGMTCAEMRNAPALVKARIETLPDPLKSNLLTLLDNAAGDPARFIAGIEPWVEKTWQRAAGWLRRRLNPRMFFVGLAIAAATNADTVRMFQVLTRDATMQEALVQTAGRLATQGKGKSLDQVLCPAPAAKTSGKPAAKGDSTDEGTTDPPAEPQTPCSELEAAKRFALDVSPLLGWEPDLKRFDGEQGTWAAVWWFLGKILGLFITAGALLMGAPFWFDMLKKLISVRQSLRPGTAADKPAPEKGEQPEQGTAEGARPAAVTPRSAGPDSRFQPQASVFRNANALWMSRFSALAYSEQPLAEAQGKEWGYQISGNFGRAGKDVQYLVAIGADSVVLAFRGTEPMQLPDWATDLKMARVPCPWCDGAGVHQGFLDALESEWQHIMALIGPHAAAKSLWITGHSLGGALALLTAHRLACTQPDLPVQGLVTFGQPRCGDEGFVADVRRRFAGCYWRAVDNRDVVPRVPPYAAGFRHAGTVVYLDDLGRMVIDPPLWYQALDNLDLPADAPALRQALLERIQDHAVSRYSKLLADAMDRTG